MYRFALPILLIAAAAPAATPQEDPPKLAKALSGMTAGTPVDCLTRDQTLNATYYPRTILYGQGRNKRWRNDTVGTCSGLARGDLVVIRTLNGQQCAGDIVETHARIGGMITGSCALGKFVPYVRE
jgi:hypothetical protein